MRKSLVPALGVSLALGVHFAAVAAPTAVPPGRIAPMDAARVLTAGEVRKVDRSARKITLKHGDIVNLGMPAMTMVFEVDDPALLDALKPGDKVHFHAERAHGALVVTRIEASR